MGEYILGKTVDGAMSDRVVTAPPEMRIEKAAKIIVSSGFRRLPVVKDNYVCGILTAADIMRYLGNGDAFKKLVTGHVDEALSAPISGIMRNNIITTGPKTSLSKDCTRHAPE